MISLNGASCITDAYYNGTKLTAIYAKCGPGGTPTLVWPDVPSQFSIYYNGDANPICTAWCDTRMFVGPTRGSDFSAGYSSADHPDVVITSEWVTCIPNGSRLWYCATYVDPEGCGYYDVCSYCPSICATINECFIPHDSQVPIMCDFFNTPGVFTNHSSNLTNAALEYGILNWNLCNIPQYLYWIFCMSTDGINWKRPEEFFPWRLKAVETRYGCTYYSPTYTEAVKDVYSPMTFYKQ